MVKKCSAVAGTLGLVPYHFGTDELAHDPRMKALLGSAGGKYPGFSAHPMESFLGIRPDAEGFIEHCLSAFSHPQSLRVHKRRGTRTQL
jgi:hypothetical protein